MKRTLIETAQEQVRVVADELDLAALAPLETDTLQWLGDAGMLMFGSGYRRPGSADWTFADRLGGAAASVLAEAAEELFELERSHA